MSSGPSVRAAPRRFLLAHPAPWIALAALILSGVSGARLRARRAASSPRASGAAAVQAGGGGSSTLTAAAVALGGFRGVLADALWLRAGRLQEKRRFTELVQLSDWITALEPENEEVWTFHAWNLAYNVSSLLPDAADRWRWVQSGVELLRDRGIPANPGSSVLRRELGWLFQHKIGSDTDSAADFYRTEWAREVSAYLGPSGEAPEADSLDAEELAGALRMDASAMRALEERFGPVDWRVPMASSLYWGMQALELARGRDDLSCRRMVYVSLAEMTRRAGRLVGDAADEDWTYSAEPNFELLDATVAFLEESVRVGGFSGTKHALATMYFDAIAIELALGREARAREWHARLCDFLRQCGLRSVPAWDALGPDTPDEVDSELERVL